MAKKVFLFVVEGISDKDALEPILSELFDESKVYFKVVCNDITVNIKNKEHFNIKNRITKVINEFINNNRGIKKTNIEKIILLSDLDGCYIDDDNIYDSSDDFFRYEDDGIYTKNVENAIMRNHIKSRNLNTIYSTSKVYKTLFIETYYFSCNLDHVLYNERNLDDNLKVSKAVEFANNYKDREEEFVDFVNTDSIKLATNYKDSWLLIQKGNNSLLRFTNLNTFFINNNDYFKNIVKERIKYYLH